MARRKKKKRGKKKLWSKKSEFIKLDGTKVVMDSTWEVACAERLDELGVEWSRDPKMKLQYRTQKLKLRNYIPDFYLPDHDIYLEVKGYWTDSARWKMRDVCSRYPGKIKIIESLDEIAELDEPFLPSTGSLSFRELLD
tara:strand:- start:770 stop:1186 length:417 start_codon:yes stop_codon:yes gene_type:complete